MAIFASYSGGDFLAFYALMLATCVLLGLWIPANLRPAGECRDIEDFEDLAMLVGGTKRHVTSVLADLVGRGAVSWGGKNTLNVSRTNIDVNGAGQAILAKVGNFNLSEAKIALSDRREKVETRLIRRGLLMDHSGRLRLSLFSILLYIALFAIGCYRYQAGSALGEPTGYLLVLLVVTMVFAGIRFFKQNPRTMAGNALVKEAQNDSSRLRRAPRGNEAGYAVALFGTAVLVGTPWAPLHAMPYVYGAGFGGGDGDGGYGDSGHGDGDGGGGGGCGGGGCGGCGG